MAKGNILHLEKFVVSKKITFVTKVIKASKSVETDLKIIAISSATEVIKAIESAKTYLKINAISSATKVIKAAKSAKIDLKTIAISAATEVIKTAKSAKTDIKINAISSATRVIKAAQSAKTNLKIIAKKMDAICAVLTDAKDIMHYTSNSIKTWLRDLRSLDIYDLLNDIANDDLQPRIHREKTVRQLRHYLSSFNPLISSFYLGRIYNILRVKLENIVVKKISFNLIEYPIEILSHDIRDPLDENPYVHEPAVVRRDDAQLAILNQVSQVRDDVNQLSVHPTVRMGGIERTTFPELGFDVENHQILMSNFEVQEGHNNDTEISSHEIRDPSDESPYVHEPAVVGRDAAEHAILNQVSQVRDDSNQLSMHPTVGMGGIGRTTFPELGFDVENQQIRMSTEVQEIHNNDTGKMRKAKIKTIKWVFLLLNVALEVCQIAFAQEKNKTKTGRQIYLNLSIITSSICLIIAVIEALHEGKSLGIVWQKRGSCCWFYYPGNEGRVFGRVSLFFALISSLIQLTMNLTAKLAQKDLQFDYMPLLLALCYLVAAIIGSSKNKSTDVYGIVEAEGTFHADEERAGSVE